MNGRVYLGDAVYASFDGFHVVLETHDGIQTTNQIFLDPNVFQNLLTFKEKIVEALVNKASDSNAGQSLNGDEA